MKKTSLCILCGGQSAEHEVSLQSTRNVISAVNQAKYNILLVGIDKRGRWHLHDPANFLVNPEDPAKVALANPGTAVVPACVDDKGYLVPLAGRRKPVPVDVAFPVLHGTFGEDGAIQGLLKMMHIPCVGCDIASSAVCMDKDAAKRLLTEAGVRVARGFALEVEQRRGVDPDVVARQLGLPLFVKPSRLGSSVGVTKVYAREGILPALDLAFRYDSKVLVEEYVAGREIECAVLGNRTPRASVPGEIVPKKDFYSYEAKYIDEDGAELKAPADLSPAAAKLVQETSVKSFRALGCSGMARVDGFLNPDGSFVVNEVNTIPGFTRISMYPRLLGLTGIGYPELVETLITLALERFREEQALCTDFHA